MRLRIWYFWLLFWHRSGIWPNSSFAQLDEFRKQCKARRDALEKLGRVG